MHVFIAGGTGVIGRQLIPQLRAAGHRVTATTSRRAKIAQRDQLGTRGVGMDGLDAAAVGEAVAAAEPDAIVHQMTALAGRMDPKHFDRWFALTNRLRSERTDHLLTGADGCGVRHVVAQSYTGWPNIRSGGMIKTEDDPLDPDPPNGQRESMAAIEHVQETVLKANGTVLRYGALYGPGASDSLVAMVRKRSFRSWAAVPE